MRNIGTLPLGWGCYEFFDLLFVFIPLWICLRSVVFFYFFNSLLQWKMRGLLCLRSVSSFDFFNSLLMWKWWQYGVNFWGILWLSILNIWGCLMSVCLLVSCLYLCLLKKLYFFLFYPLFSNEVALVFCPILFLLFLPI